MNRTLLVLRYELLTNIRRRSFLFMAFGLPVIVVLVFFVLSALSRSPANVSGSTTGSSSGGSALHVEGYVDHAGLIKAMPSDLPPGTLVAYPDEASVRQALRSGEITAYYIIPTDFVQSGKLIYVNPEYSWASYKGQAWVMRQTLTANLLGNDQERLRRFWNAMKVETKALAPVQERDEDNRLAFYIPYATMMLFYVVILLSASLLLESVSKEKQNRVMEILMASVTPRQLLSGKIIGLGISGLVQTAIWLATGYTLLRLSGRTFNLPPGLQLPPSILFWGIVFFLLGYALYACLLAALGALVPNLKEGSQATFLVIWPMIIPLFVIGILIEQPDSPLAIVLSLLPPTAPTTMMLRLATGGVPLWQLLAAVALLLVAVYFVLRAVASAFRAQYLLSGQPFSAKLYVKALLGKEK